MTDSDILAMVQNRSEQGERALLSWGYFFYKWFIPE